MQGVTRLTKAPAVATAPLLMAAEPWADYALLDSGEGRKLERYGSITVVRPEAQCLWRPAEGAELWEAAHAVFEAAADEDRGKWRISRPVPAEWALRWGTVRFYARLASFRHLGVFPEHAANWDWVCEQAALARRPLRVLNLFGYTGIASLVAASLAAEVTHVDASKPAVAWARENAELSGLSDAPIRWICEDARRYVQREARRGSRYDAIILDPPKYGRGPDGEVWRLYEHLPELLAGCAALLTDDARFVLLNAYSERFSGLAMAGLMQETLAGRQGIIEWGELALMEQNGRHGAGLSFFARWTP